MELELFIFSSTQVKVKGLSEVAASLSYEKRRICDGSMNFNLLL